MRVSLDLIILGTVSAGIVSAVPYSKPTGDDCVDGHLPTIDLGYVKQQATQFNKSGNFFRFNNIAFAQPPLGDLRFAAPQPPKQIAGIQNGGTSLPRCPQSYPDWLIQRLSAGFVQHVPQNASQSETEDCLYLDVLVPKPILDRRYRSRGAPVMVWIYGGGYVLGSKSDDLEAAGLIKRSMDTTGSEGIVYVAMNYRLGNFGFLGGPRFRSEGGDSNAGLLDQRLALEWVKANIAKFGGDPDRITVFGESGGASSVAHQITASGPGAHYPKLTFQQAILQSPAESAINPDDSADALFETFLDALKVKTLAEARALDTAVLQKVNYDLVQAFPTGVFEYAVTKDDIFGDETARKAMLAGRTNNIKVMASYNLNEGTLFAPAEGFTNDDFAGLVSGYIPNLSNAQLDYVVNTLYPAKAFPNAQARAVSFVGEAAFSCNAAAVQRAYGLRGYAYEFSVSSALPLPVGFHTEDLAFTYFNGPNPGSDPANSTIAEDLQTYLVNFAVHGDPNAFVPSVKLPKMPVYGKQHHMLNFTDTAYPVVRDPLAQSEGRKRCDFFNQF